ncbi:MAG: hypothetical protein SVY10_11365 [Thermodesulfobacteriota bacterium]|nr:hypothetical protein [Thermodesulfobacteriota bacterium]
MENKQVEDIKRHFSVVAEGLRDEIKLVAEGVVNLNDKFEREINDFRKENREAHGDIKVAIKFSYTELDRRITTLENKYEDVERRLKKLEVSL